MTGPDAIETVTVNGEECRVWRKGKGAPVAFLAGFGGLPKWIPFLDELAATNEVVVPSMPGYPGATGHTKLDEHIDWILAVRDLLNRVGLEDGTRLVGSGPGGAFAAEMAVFWPHKVSKLALIAPWGLFDDDAPMTDPWGQRKPEQPALLCEDPEAWNELRKMPEGANSVEWPVQEARAAEASARAFWPLGNTGLAKRLGRIQAPTRLIWGEADRIVPRRYAETFRDGIAGPAEIAVIAGAGHLAELDKPKEVAAAIASFVN